MFIPDPLFVCCYSRSTGMAGSFVALLTLVRQECPVAFPITSRHRRPTVVWFSTTFNGRQAAPKYTLVLKCWRKNLGQFSKNYRSFYPKNCH
jgi:hypothetical protein